MVLLSLRLDALHHSTFPLQNVFSLMSDSRSQKNCAKSDGEAGFGSMSLMSSTTTQKITETVRDAPREPVDVFMSKMRNLSGMTPAPFSFGGSAGSSFMDKCARELVWTARMTPPRDGESTRACADCSTATATRSPTRKLMSHNSPRTTRRHYPYTVSQTNLAILCKILPQGGRGVDTLPHTMISN